MLHFAGCLDIGCGCMACLITQTDDSQQLSINTSLELLAYNFGDVSEVTLSSFFTFGNPATEKSQPQVV